MIPSPVTFLVLWSRLFSCLAQWFHYFLGSVGSHREGEHGVDAVLKLVSKVSALWEGGDLGCSQFGVTWKRLRC